MRATDATADDAKPPFGLTFANTGPGSPGNFEPFTTECPDYFAGYDNADDDCTVVPRVS
ncbi:MAG: hypothetical protein U5L95_05575 [Candidatus Saccharibacteria bacterium]|nr:hypothetical protein [Candidatus Saccharibacteria bacterium]